MTSDSFKKNLARGKVWIDTYGLKPYNGRFDSIDLDAEWFCPVCLAEERKLVIGSDNRLHCTAHYLKCEYTYANPEDRVAMGVFLTEGYSYPLTELEFLKIKKKRLKQVIKIETKIIKTQRERIKKLKTDLEICNKRIKNI
ncbi:hypothetical protein [Photobacterium kishitanii]|uniref:Uncharacterized protein n=1 Tax=Photobacterium kishitanii TaxID=318456 RepID=A0A2T3KL82_9GAMM|nr:hypothetical protein [Photobacterium kishitanii]PSV00413.1 hypothetical protein C9J27_04595 [Photobacterium kishitanii]